MSGVVMMLMAGGGGFPQGFSAGVSNNSAATGVRSGTFSMNSDGTTQQTVHGSFVSGPVWYSTAPTSGVGSLYWAS